MSKKPFFFFDLGNVVFSFSGGLEKLAEIFEVDIQNVKDVFFQYDDKICKGEMRPQELLRIYEKIFNKSTGIENFAQWWVGFFQPIQTTRDLMLELYINGNPIGIITNIYPEVFDLIKSRGIIPDIEYHVVVQSCEVGLVKPDPRIFLHAQEIIGDSHSPFLIDDSLNNIETAQELGWGEQCFNPLHPEESVREIEVKFSFLNIEGVNRSKEIFRN